VTANQPPPFTPRPHRPTVRALIIPVQPNPPSLQRISAWPDLASLQHLVDGYVDIRYGMEEGWHLYCAESSSTRASLNLKATDLVRQLDKRSPPVYGTAVVVGTGAGGVDTDVPEELAKHVLKRT
jgi:hypothetical protein